MIPQVAKVIPQVAKVIHLAAHLDSENSNVFHFSRSTLLTQPANLYGQEYLHGSYRFPLLLRLCLEVE